MTPIQRKVLAYYEQRAREGFAPPTLRELCREFGWRSTATARDHIRALTRKGLLQPARGRARGATLRRRQFGARPLPLLGEVVAGIPVSSHEAVEKQVFVSEHMVRNERSFVLRVRGDSMEGASILEGDLVVVAPDPDPRPGSIVVVTLDGETTLKRLERSPDGWVLVAENPRYPSIPVKTPESLVHGVVTGVLRVVGVDSKRKNAPRAASRAKTQKARRVS